MISIVVILLLLYALQCYSSNTTSPSSQPSSLPSLSPSSQPSSKPTTICLLSESVASALEDFYLSTQGSASCIGNSWFSTSYNDPCDQQWYGISCNNTCNIIGISLPSCGLQGTIPNSITNIKTLSYLDLHNNDIIGTIPNSITNITQLTYLRLSGNRLSGPLPIGMSSLQSLSYIYLRDNELSGNIPSWLFSLTKVVALDLSYNKFRGSLNITSTMKDLELLNLESNKISGGFPNFEYLTSLQTLFLGQNCFASGDQANGVDLANVCNLNSLQTLIIDGLSNNCDKKEFIILRGDVPSCLFTDMSNLTQLSIEGNFFGGKLPELSSNSSLVNVSLSDNKITGNLPKSFQALGFMNFDISFNRINGQLEDDFNTESSVKIVMLVNRLSGPAPTSFKETSAQLNILGGNLFGCDSVNPFSISLDSDIFHKHFYCGTTAANR